MNSSLVQVASQTNIPPVLLIGGTTVLMPRDNLGRSDTFLAATLQEMIKIEDINGDVQQGSDSFISTTRTRFHQLTLQKPELEQSLRSKNLNPFKIFANHRIARDILAKSQTLYMETKEHSESLIRRRMLTIHDEEIKPVLVTTTPTESLDYDLTALRDHHLAINVFHNQLLTDEEGETLTSRP